MPGFFILSNECWWSLCSSHLAHRLKLLQMRHRYRALWIVLLWHYEQLTWCTMPLLFWEDADDSWLLVWFSKSLTFSEIRLSSTFFPSMVIAYQIRKSSTNLVCSEWVVSGFSHANKNWVKPTILSTLLSVKITSGSSIDVIPFNRF